MTYMKKSDVKSNGLNLNTNIFKTAKRFGSFGVPEGEDYSHVTKITVPNLAPTMLELINASSTSGQPLPLTGQPQYDESEEAGIARSIVQHTDIGELAEQYESERQSQEAAHIGSHEHESEHASEAEHANDSAQSAE